MVVKNINFDDKKRKVTIELSEKKYTKIKNFINDNFNTVDDLNIKLKDNQAFIYTKEKSLDYTFAKNNDSNIVEKEFNLSELNLFDTFYLRFSDGSIINYMVVPRAKDVAYVSVPDGLPITKTIPKGECMEARVMSNHAVSLDHLKVLRRVHCNNDGELSYGEKDNYN